MRVIHQKQGIDNGSIAESPSGSQRRRGALRCDRRTASRVFDGPINGRCFRAYVEQQLVPFWSQATSSSWTISAPTNPRLSARWSEKPVPGSGSCRHTLRISIRSNRPLPRLSIGCERHRTERSRTLCGTSATSSLPSNPTSAKITSQTSGTLSSRMNRSISWGHPSRRQRRSGSCLQPCRSYLRP